eukprot:1214811-Pleurochrysis_carterae.AAC.2
MRSSTDTSRRTDGSVAGSTPLCTRASLLAWLRTTPRGRKSFGRASILRNTACPVCPPAPLTKTWRGLARPWRASAHKMVSSIIPADKRTNIQDTIWTKARLIGKAAEVSNWNSLGQVCLLDADAESCLLSSPPACETCPLAALLARRAAQTRRRGARYEPTEIPCKYHELE